MRRYGVAVLAVVLAGCEPIEPCDDYVAYMCDCHGDDTGVECSDFEATYLGAGPAVQDECAVLLDEQESADLDAGFECGV